MSTPSLAEYRNSVNNLRKRAKQLNLSDDQIDEVFENTFKLFEESPNNKSVCAKISVVLKLSLALIPLGLIAYILLNVHQPTSSIVLRNVQGLIYPGLKVLRILSMPIIKRFPSLTELYDETCLVENPYFYVSDMECWPCENVNTVIDLTGFDNHSLYQSGIPYVVQTNQNPVNFDNLQKMYRSNKLTFDKDASAVKSTNATIRTASDLFAHHPMRTQSSEGHASWRINRMEPARVIRKLFPRPYIISQWSGQSLERYLMVDEPKAKAYALPNPECSYVFVVQGSGVRRVVLKPSRECEKNCQTVSVVLKPSHVLWYNWWYWRPVSVPVDNSTDVSISYIGCYC